MNTALASFSVLGFGKALPEGRLDNQALARDLGIEPESILSRTGIEERRVAGPGDSASGLGARAALEALEKSGRRAADIQLVLLSTYTPDTLLCPTAPFLAHRIGAVNAGAFDLNSACSGGVTALLTASCLLASGPFHNAMVVTSDLTTRFVRKDDEKTRMIFGDGAAAFFLERPAPGAPGQFCVLSSLVGADGAGAGLFCVPEGGSARPSVNGEHHPEACSVVMDGKAIFRFGVSRGADVISRTIQRAGLEPKDVRWVIPHQANLRIISALIDKTGITEDRWVVNIERYGNTASTSIPLALAELLESGRAAAGDVALLVGFGAGLTWSAMALRLG